MSNVNTFEMPHIEITGKIERALAYKHPKSSDDGRDMYGVIFRVRVKEYNPRILGGDSVIKVNVPMNKHEDLIYAFNCITEGVTRTAFDDLEINEYVGSGIRMYIRLKEITNYGTEYKVNEDYPVEFMDEPIFMDKLPDIPTRDRRSNNGSNQGQARSGLVCRL